MNFPERKARIRPWAARDLEEIVRYLDERSETASDRFLSEFLHAVNVLAEMPRVGCVNYEVGLRDCARGR
jgi:plasmid stabilization system protein ParE